MEYSREVWEKYNKHAISMNQSSELKCIKCECTNTQKGTKHRNKSFRLSIERIRFCCTRKIREMLFSCYNGIKGSENQYIKLCWEIVLQALSIHMHHNSQQNVISRKIEIGNSLFFYKFRYIYIHTCILHIRNVWVWLGYSERETKGD